jgi:translation initiation factor 1
MGVSDVSRRYAGEVSTKRPDHPFASLAALKDQLPRGPDVTAPSSAASSATPPRVTDPVGAAASAAPAAPARAVVRLERKGRGGKEVTVVEKLELKPAELERWTKELKQALGTGGAVDGPMIVLQGDVRPRVEALLRARGVRKVTVA